MDIRLGVLEAIDLPQIQRWRNDDRLRHGFREYRLLSLIDQRDWFDHISRSREVEMFGVFLGPELIGVCGLCNINWVNRTAEISFYVVPPQPGMGLQAQTLELLRQKAFGEFNLHRLGAETYSFRSAQIAQLEKAGYVQEGVMRKHVFKLGEYHDSIIHGMVNDECVGNCHGR